MHDLPGIEDIGHAMDRIARRMLDHDEPDGRPPQLVTAAQT
jgi:hypothetical protein